MANKMTVKAIEDEIRDIVNWVSVFDTEYDLPEEVVSQLKDRLLKLAKDIGSL